MQSSPHPRPVIMAVGASDSACDAAARAVDIAADWSAPLHLLHVVTLALAAGVPVSLKRAWCASRTSAAVRL
jgi:universal stress protein family protein